jgi:hypothetical protein
MATSRHGAANQGDDQSDLASLWQEASMEYYSIIKIKPSELQQFRSMDDILKDQDIQTKFKKVCLLSSRHTKLTCT